MLNYSFWKFFKEISNIPRKSGEEEKIAQYLVDFAQKRNMRFYRDKVNNVIIWKESSNSSVCKETIGLQCHTDMICEKTANTKHDFSNDPLTLYIDGDFIKAKDTTLGADNGIGIAYILAILDSQKISVPNLECIFTAQEETTMDGANFLDSSILKSKKIISFDNFNEDEMWISSATAKEWTSTIEDKRIQLDKDKFTVFSLKLKNFKGGHSGLDISDENRGNPIKIIADILDVFSEIYISDFNGGTKANIIPRDCNISFAINNYEIKKVDIMKENIDKLYKKYSLIDVEFKKVDNNMEFFNEKTSKNILGFINSFQNGSINKDNYDNTILSGNFAAVQTNDDFITLLYSIRYNNSSMGKILVNEIQENMKKYNILSKKNNCILGYEQDENSKLIKICEDLYYKYFNKKIKKIRVQACLECGYLAKKIPNLEYIAIAPNIYDAHSPNERMSIKSANKMWGFIIKLLECLNTKN